MSKISLKEVLKEVAGKVIKKGTREPEEVSTDSRKIKSNDIFFALKGERFNGNYYAYEAATKGAAVCIIDELHNMEENIPSDCTVILVEDVKEAFWKLAQYYRKKLGVKIIGVTGSTGKTSTKDLIAAALSSKFKVFKTLGNFNNEIGLPLMIFSLDESYEVAVLEMGMSSFGEIDRLSSIAKPDIAVITNIGISHIENLGSRENILKAKLEITNYFTKDKVLIVNNDNDLLSTVDNEDYKIVRIAIDNLGDYRASNLSLTSERISFVIIDKAENESVKASFNLLGKHNVYNILCAVACARELGLNYEDIIKGVHSVEKTPMRLEISNSGGITIINDCYNASPDSMKSALEVLSTFSGKKIAVLGKMNELGSESRKAHKEVASYARERGIDILAAIGEVAVHYREGFGEQGFICFENKEQAIEYLLKNLKSGDNVLVKASRTLAFEEIAQKLKKSER